MNSIASSNRLTESISPYLKQHVNNPVNWQPWDEEALFLAKEKNVPIFLSIGYAACHWCHVMEEESFSNEDIAQDLNENFVCIKVDREERPDIDKTYQLAHYLLSRQSGGWPLTVILAPDLVPFFTGTYFPPTPHGQMPSLPQIVERINKVWANNQKEVIEQNDNILKAIQSIDDLKEFNKEDINYSLVEKVATEFESAFDYEKGGLGRAPKFPQAPSLSLCLNLLANEFADLKPGMVKTLDAMAQGGLNDHVGGGFFRYCVDPIWSVPHFEKMLSDNAQLLDLYASAAKILDNPAYEFIAKQTANWMIEEMKVGKGAFVSSLDADSEGEEGKYYVWDHKELSTILSKEDLTYLDQHTNTGTPANFEAGKHHIHLSIQDELVNIDERLIDIFTKLKQQRKHRIKPAVDTKATVSNCSLAANSLIKAGLILNNNEYIEIAKSSLEFIDEFLVTDKRLKTLFCANQTSDIYAFLDDYAYLLLAKTTMLQVCCTNEDVTAIENLVDEIFTLFDDGKGALLFTAKDAPQTIRKARVSDDGATPSGNGIIAIALTKLAWILAKPDFLDKAQAIIHAFGWHLMEGGTHSPTLINALANINQPAPVITLVGEEDDIKLWRDKLRFAYAKGMTVLTIIDEVNVSDKINKPKIKDIKVAAYVCRGFTCSEAIVDFERLLIELGE